MSERYIGLISGTSMDGVDAALVAFDDAGRPTVERFLCHPYPGALAGDLAVTIADPSAVSALSLARLDMRVGAVFADAVSALLTASGHERTAIRAVGSHGQTIYHGAAESPPISLQIGHPALIAERTGIDVIADLRAADLVAGGQAAPLAPAVHAALMADPRESRAVLNLGGIANLTGLPPTGEVIGFDSGPGNGLMDAWCQCQHGEPYDDGGRWAASGQADSDLLERLLSDPYFTTPPPKSTGRETFHLDWLSRHLTDDLAAEDIQATLLELTVESVARALDWIESPARLLVCGGGVHNTTLMTRLSARLAAVKVTSVACLGIDPDSVEALLFAWLARQHLLGRPGNLPGVTGASGPRVLGARYPAS